MDRITLSVPADADFHGALRLVVGGIAMRSQLSYEQTSELQLAVESLVAHRAVEGDAIVLEADLDGSRLSLLIGPFAPDEDRGGLRVLRRLVGGVEVVRRDGHEWLELTSEGIGP
jgi:hypothetical protein